MTPHLQDTIAELLQELERENFALKDGHAGKLGLNLCKTRQSLTHMRFANPSVMLVVQGTKRVTIEDRSYEVSAGEMLVLPADVKFDVENIPDNRHGQYIAVGIQFDTETLALFRSLYGAQFENWDLSSRWIVKGSAAVVAAAASWIAWVRRFSTDQTQVRHRMIELLLLFAGEGLAGNLLLQHHQSLGHRLKQLLQLDPARAWRIQDACRQLGVSESTLRRKLREEGVGFRELLEDVRLSHGMVLIMSSNMPIGQVSLGCGYQSQSRFAERFKRRFSMSPVALRESQQAVRSDENIVPLFASGDDDAT